MPRPHRTALMPVGTVIEHDGTRYRKTHGSNFDEEPWSADDGGGCTDERMDRIMDRGARVTKPIEVTTVKDLPPGSEVTGRYTVWVKNRPGRNECWTSTRGECVSDGTIDRLLTESAYVSHVPERQ